MFRRITLLVAVLLLAVPTAFGDSSKPLNRPGLPLRPEPVEVQLADGSRIFLSVVEEQIDVVTPYGKLQYRLADVLKIEFGIRVPTETVKQIDAAVAALMSTGEKKPDAWIALANVKEFAYPALLRLSRHTDAAIARKAGEMLAILKKATPAERLARIDRDVIHTEFSRISGRIEASEFRVVTPHFGAMKLQLAHLARLSQGEPAEPEEVPVNVQPDPGYLSNFQQHVSKSFYFRVTGAAGGSVWGSDVYTSDSTLAAVAVHAGVLKMGQTGIVKVTILPGQNGYVGSTRNGISTSNYGPYPGSYKVSKVGQKKEDD